MLTARDDAAAAGMNNTAARHFVLLATHLDGVATGGVEGEPLQRDLLTARDDDGSTARIALAETVARMCCAQFFLESVTLQGKVTNTLISTAGMNSILPQSGPSA